MTQTIFLQRASLIGGLLAIWMIGPFAMLWLGMLFDLKLVPDWKGFLPIYPIGAILLFVASWFRSAYRSAMLLWATGVVFLTCYFLGQDPLN